MEFGWMLGTIIILQLQQLIGAPSLVSNEKLKPVLQKGTHEDEGPNKLSNILQSSKNYRQNQRSDLTYTILPLTQKRRHIHTTKAHTPNQNGSRNYWSKKSSDQLKVDYEITTEQSSLHPNDSHHSDLRTDVAGYQVRVMSAHKSYNKETDFNTENLETGHKIEIIPVESKNNETLSSELNNDPVIEKQEVGDVTLNSLELPSKFSEQVLVENFPTESRFITDPVTDEIAADSVVDDDMSEEERISSEGGDKTGRVLHLISRSNTSSCTTPTGESGHCRRLSECLLSDALNNFSLFLQYLCMMRGPFVGICCPNNPVIEISDGEDSVYNTTQELKQPKEGCGQNSNTRIVGGSLSVPHEWTWMVALMRKNRFYCGGVILNDWYILTAAHCVLGIRVKDLTVRLGEYNFQENNIHQRDLPVAEIKRHAQFVTMTFQHDIALLKLKRKVEYSKFVGSICLPDKNARDYTEVNATVVGWGTVSFGGAASPVLRQVTIPVWSNKDCDRTYVLESITDSFMCAGSPKSGEDACQGDSGGPLMALNGNGRWEVIGIVSWGRRCGDPTYPGVYTRVTTYIDWIVENMQ